VHLAIDVDFGDLDNADLGQAAPAASIWGFS